MALWAPRGKGDQRIQHNVGSVGSTLYGTQVTTGGASGTKGTPAEMIASTSFDTHYIRIVATNYGTSAAAAGGCLDILTGAATEDVLIPNLLMGCAGNIGGLVQGPKTWEFPLYIPAGTRISAQACGERVATAFRVGIILYGGTSISEALGTRVETYGVSAPPSGTTMTVGSTGAAGTWAEVTASTTREHYALFPSFQITGDSTLVGKTYNVGIGLGAATEELLGDGYLYGTDTAEMMSGPCMPIGCIEKHIPSGTRLVIRASCSAAPDGPTCNGAIHAVY